MNVKYGITEWGLPGTGRYTVKFTAEAGLQGLQLDFGTYEGGYFMAQKRMMDAYMEDGAKYGVEFPSLVLNDLGKHGFVDGPESPDYEIAMDQVWTGLNCVKYMGIDTLMVPQFWANEITDDKKFDNAVKVFKQVCEKAAEDNITIMSETTLNADRMLDQLQAVDMPNLFAFYDSQNYDFFKGYDQKETLDKLYPYIGTQLHVKSSVGHDWEEGGVLSGALLWEAESKFKITEEKLKKEDYSGWIILEDYYYVKPVRDRNEDQYALLQQDVDFLKKTFG
ncbi:MAG: sugar phosphate isomerase/epimerase family protein [Christensenellaceae bacterium]|jgi:sugar phosphate isomerase/epimerase